MIIAFLEFIILIAAIFLAGFLVNGINEWYNKTFKKDCHKCKHFYLANVASFGDGCEFACRKTGYRTIPMISINERHHWKKCNEFEEETENKQ